jgi:hypothetical protein
MKSQIMFWLAPIVKHCSLSITGKNYVVELFFRSSCFIFFSIELIIDVNAEPCSIMVAFHKRTGMLRVGSQPRTPE